MLNKSSVLAFWLIMNHDTKVYDYDRGKEVIYWYSPTDRCFMYQIPDNKVKNKPMKARGLCQRYIEYLDYARSFDSAIPHLKARDLFDMT